MSTVRTQEELQAALQRKERKINVKGPLAEKYINRKKKANIAKFGAGIALAAGSIAALPFTGGASAIGIGAGATAMGLTIGTITISAAELTILVGAAIAAYGIKKGSKVRIISKRNEKGQIEAEIEITPNYK